MLPIYKKSAALQISLIRSVRKNDKFRSILKNGAVFMEFANAVAGKEKEYDWANKASFAISTNDYPLIYSAYMDLKTTGKIGLKLIHDPNAGTDNKGKSIKTLSLFNGQNQGTFFFTINTTNPEVKVSVPLSKGELYMIIKFIEDNQNAVLGETNVMLVNGDE